MSIFVSFRKSSVEYLDSTAVKSSSKRNNLKSLQIEEKLDNIWLIHFFYRSLNEKSEIKKHFEQRFNFLPGKYEMNCQLLFLLTTVTQLQPGLQTLVVRRKDKQFVEYNQLLM